jgi:hypothetical protein
VGETQITDELRRFILVSFPSVPHLEALLLLRRDPQRGWIAPTLARNLYIDERRAADVLRELAAVELIAADAHGDCRYAPASPALRDLVDQLADVYAHALVPVTNIIHGRSAELFADAFKLRKE